MNYYTFRQVKSSGFSQSKNIKSAALPLNRSKYDKKAETDVVRDFTGFSIPVSFDEARRGR